MQKPLMRIPYTGPLPPPIIVPRYANTPTGAIFALTRFLSAPRAPHVPASSKGNGRTVLLTGAGVSVASGLADYRGTAGTYTLNKTYRPIYYNEFISNHEARKRYWARSFLGWTNLHKARPNAAHWAVRDLGQRGFISDVITQSRSFRAYFQRRLHPDNIVPQMSTPFTPRHIQNCLRWSFTVIFARSSASTVETIYHERISNIRCQH